MGMGNPVLSSPMEGNPDCLALPRSAQHHMPSTHFPTFTVMAAVCGQETEAWRLTAKS